MQLTTLCTPCIAFMLVSHTCIITIGYEDPLGGKWRQLIGKVGEWFVASWHLQGYSLCLCWLRTDGLTHASKYWTYRSHVGDIDPVSLVAGWRPIFGFLHCFIGWLEREIGYGPTDRSAGVLRIMSGAIFSGAVTLSSAVDDVRSVAICGPREIRIVLDHT
jgi:hypothetical protein